MTFAPHHPSGSPNANSNPRSLRSSPTPLMQGRVSTPNQASFGINSAIKNSSWQSNNHSWTPHSWDQPPISQNLAVPRPMGLAEDDPSVHQRFEGSPSSPAKTSTLSSESSPLTKHSVSSLLSGSYTSVDDAAAAMNRMHLHGDGARQKPMVPHLHVPPHPAPVPQVQYSPFHGAYYGRRDVMDYGYPYSPVRPTTDHFSSPILYAGPSIAHGSQEAQRNPTGVYYMDYANNGGASSPNPYYYNPTIAFPSPHTPHAVPSVSSNRMEREAPPHIAQRQVPPMHSFTFAGAPLFNNNNARRDNQNYKPSGGIPSHMLGGDRYRRETIRDAQQAVRSPVLTDFKNNKSRKWELRDILSHCVEFSCDQHGSRFIQQKMESANSEERNAIFQEIVPQSVMQLSRDVFGNYVIQKLFEHGSQVQKNVLCNTLKGQVLPLSLDVYGCRVVQKAIENVLPDQQSSIVRELEAHVLRCVKDANGNHVIQKLLERVIAERPVFIRQFSGFVYDLSTHPYGCRVLQRCLEYASPAQCRPLLDELRSYYLNLMKDQFGNYVVQFVLENGPEEDRQFVVSQMRGHLLDMARHKFASNVCEKALAVAPPETRHGFVNEMLALTQVQDEVVSGVIVMMKDQFANYVLQRALKLLEGQELTDMVAIVWPQLLAMRRQPTTFSKHLNAIERLLREKGMRFQIPPTDEQASSSGTPTP